MEKEFNDAMGIPLKEGDQVAYSSTETSSIYYAYIIGFTPKKVKIMDKWGRAVNKFPYNLASVQANKEMHPEFYL